jgi:cell division transport system permease protein
MNWVTIKRVLRAGLQSFSRNAFVSFSSVLAMTQTLFMFGLMIFAGVILSTTLEDLRAKADINVYFVTSATEQQILDTKTQVEALPEVASVEYLSRDEALAQFRERHKADQLTLNALDELGENPFGGVINISAKEIGQYESISSFLKNQQTQAGSASIIDNISFYDEKYRLALDRLESITTSGGRLGTVVLVLFIVTTITTLLNLIRLTIYTSRDEIHVMRLVGAGGLYIRGPFMIEGMLQGLIAGVLTLLLFYPLTWWLGNSTSEFFGGVNIYNFYISHFLVFFLVMVGTGVILGGLANFLAVRRYLKI